MTPRPRPAAASSYRARPGCATGCGSAPICRSLSTNSRPTSAWRTVSFRSSTPRGPTGRRLAREGTIGLCDPANVPLDLQIGLDRPRARPAAPRPHAGRVRRAVGRVQAQRPGGREGALVRGQPGEPVDLSATVDCRDVAAVYRHFQYPLDHLTGRLTLEKNMLAVKLQTRERRPASTSRGDDQEPGRRCRGPARHSGRVDSDRRRPQERNAAARAQGRRSVQSQRRGQGPCQCLSQTVARPARPARGPDQDRRRDRFDRAVRDHLGTACRTRSAT